MSGVIGGVGVDIFCVKLFMGWCTLFLLSDVCIGSCLHKEKQT